MHWITILVECVSWLSILIVTYSIKEPAQFENIVPRSDGC